MKVQCVAPFIECFSDSSGGYRNCCMTDPQIVSDPSESVENWWNSRKLEDFRKLMQGTHLPKDCWRCDLQEKTHQESFRMAINKTLSSNEIETNWPSRWNVHFGNTCNLACWSCNEQSSSVIESQKRTLRLLPASWKSPNHRFSQEWPDLKASILKSYTLHQSVTVTLVGGEPLFNPDVISFLQHLKDLGLSSRTKLEFHTNGTHVTNKVQQILSKGVWQYVCIFLSIDAVGRKAEWLRYGTDWARIETNLPIIQDMADYLEVHCVLGVLNLKDLYPLMSWCQSNALKLKVNPMGFPTFMSLRHWDGQINDIISQSYDHSGTVDAYLEILGSQPITGSKSQLINHIRSFDPVRRPLKEFDPELAASLGLEQ